MGARVLVLSQLAARGKWILARWCQKKWVIRQKNLAKFPVHFAHS